MSSPRGRRWTLGIGVGLVLGGLALLGFAGWQYIGTTIVSHHRQDEAVGQVRDGWSRGTTEARTDWGTVGALVLIPRFGTDYVMPVVAGTSDRALSAGLGHFADTAAPGEVGNFALAGHRITHGQPLHDLPDLRVGDAIIVETAKSVFTYRLTTDGDALEVDSDATWVLAPVPHNPKADGVEPAQVTGQRLLTLSTCAEVFHTDHRLVAFGVLESVRTR
jgi:sortase A